MTHSSQMPCPWSEYANDFDAMTDEEIEQEVRIEERKLDEAESWLEAVAAWKAAGRPRANIMRAAE